MVRNRNALTALASLALGLGLGLAGCGSADGAGSAPEAGGPAATSAAAPALGPDGPTARTIGYRCTSGRRATLIVDVPDLRDLADKLDRIQPCEDDQGFESGTVTITCDSGPRQVALRGSEGSVVQPPESSLCLE
jgi:hypothetical protein